MVAIYFHQTVPGSCVSHILRWMFCVGIFVVYSNALQESANSILYNGLIEELVDVLQITDKQLVVRNNYAPQSFHNAFKGMLHHMLSQKSCYQMRLTDTYAVVLII